MTEENQDDNYAAHEKHILDMEEGRQAGFASFALTTVALRILVARRLIEPVVALEIIEQATDLLRRQEPEVPMAVALVQELTLRWAPEERAN